MSTNMNLKIISLLTMMTPLLVGGPLEAQSPTAPAKGDDKIAVKIPSESTPAYYCTAAYFEGQAYPHLRGNHFHRVLDPLGIPRTSPLKEAGPAHPSRDRANLQSPRPQ